MRVLGLIPALSGRVSSGLLSWQLGGLSKHNELIEKYYAKL